MSLIAKLFGNHSARQVEKYGVLVERVKAVEKRQVYSSLEKVKDQTKKYQAQLAGKEWAEQKKILEVLIPDAFALVRAGCRLLVGKEYAVLGEPYAWIAVPFDVQLLGGLALHEGKIAEMKTGEGKSLAALIAPAYLNALAGRGVHIVTANEYLARRDAERVGMVFREMGLSVGVVAHGQTPAEKQVAYHSDITYGTNNEFGFDYLRDNMAQEWEQMVQRPEPHYAIVDEIDSILIDEARTPLIISAPDMESGKMYEQFARVAPRLKENDHYNIDEKHRSVALTNEGVEKVEELVGIQDIYNDKGIVYVHHLEQALRAQVLFQKDKEYIVRDGQVLIVDQFTGRVMPGRRFSDGLHQALEAKEGVAVQEESKTLATITFQNYFRLYHKLAGATGTAITSEEEFLKVYGLDVVEIPTHKPMIRADLPDMIYRTEAGKFQAVAAEIRARHEKGQPILVGTVSIEKSEHLSSLLKKEGIPHQVLNAKYHEQEAKIIAHAGEKGMVTIATNMAGRGTDIILGSGVVEVGGLHVLGTERHEARRIDNQLRGRSGRQGDPGSSQFFISAEDELVRRFAGDRIKSILDTFKVPENQPLQSRLLSHRIEGAQKQVEGYNFDIRRYVLQYDDVMNKQRETIYRKRREILAIWRGTKKELPTNPSVGAELRERMLGYLREEGRAVTRGLISEDTVLTVDIEEFRETINTIVPVPDNFHAQLNELVAKTPRVREVLEKNITEFIDKLFAGAYAARERDLGPALMRQIEKTLMLRTIDGLWMQHLETMESLREGIGLQGYGQKDPLVEFKREGYNLFRRMIDSIRHGLAHSVFKVKVAVAPSKELQTGSWRTGAADDSKVSARTRPAVKPKIGRNDPCPCGSGKKYKKCHGKE